jgi:hypothetical protein
MMKRILLLMVLVLVLVVPMLYGQVAPGQVQFQPLVDFDGLFIQLRFWLGGMLKEHLGLLLSLFFAACVFQYVAGMLEKRRDRLQRSQRIQRYVSNMEERQEARRIFLERESKRWEQERAERRRRECHSREMQDIISSLEPGESFADIGGDHYIRSELHGVVTYRTLEQWKQDRDADREASFLYDDEGNARQYEDFVDRDNWGGRRSSRNNSRGTYSDW